MSTNKRGMAAFVRQMKEEDVVLWDRFTDAELENCLEAYEAAKSSEQPDDCRALFEKEAARLGLILERSKLHPEHYLHSAPCIAWSLWQTAWNRPPKRES